MKYLHSHPLPAVFLKHFHDSTLFAKLLSSTYRSGSCCSSFLQIIGYLKNSSSTLKLWFGDYFHAYIVWSCIKTKTNNLKCACQSTRSILSCVSPRWPHCCLHTHLPFLYVTCHTHFISVCASDPMYFFRLSEIIRNTWLQSVLYHVLSLLCSIVEHRFQVVPKNLQIYIF